METEDKECSLGTDLSLTINSQSQIRNPGPQGGPHRGSPQTAGRIAPGQAEIPALPAGRRNSNIAISVRNLSKKYQLYETPIHRLKEAMHPFKKKYHREFWAVRDVSFEAMQGETVGILGQNGSGKSTLLQMICGTLTPTLGNVIVNGRVSALLELGAGFNPQFTGRENVYMNGAIMGFSSQEIDARFEEIASFADIGDFLSQPVKTYSSGMYVRLAFAVAINVDPMILIVDEALSVGDAKFQRKCYAKLEDFRKKDVTILFVSHDINTIIQICNRAILLDKGQIIDQGEPKCITRLYHKILFGEEIKSVQKSVIKQNEKAENKLHKDKETLLAEKEELETKRLKELVLRKLKDHNSDKKAEIIDFGILDENGGKVIILEMNQKYMIFSRVLFYEDMEEIFFNCQIVNKQGVKIFGTNTEGHKILVPPQKKKNIIEVQFYVTMLLRPGDYFLNLGVKKDLSTNCFYERLTDVLHFKVISNLVFGGLVGLDEEIKVKNIS